MTEEQSTCRHLNAKIEARFMIPRAGCADGMVRVQANCPDCHRDLRFLGIGHSWLPDAPHPEGSEDDGTDAGTVYLPGLWMEKA